MYVSLSLTSILFQAFLQEIMSSMEKQERVEKLEETFQNIVEGYAKMLTVN